MNRYDMDMSAPDFVIAGGYWDGRVVLLASKTLREAELKYERIMHTDCIMHTDWHNHRAFDYPADEYGTLTCVFRDYIMVSGPDYPSAWRALFDIWSPQGEHRLSIERKQKELKNHV